LNTREEGIKRLPKRVSSPDEIVHRLEGGREVCIGVVRHGIPHCCSSTVTYRTIEKNEEGFENKARGNERVGVGALYDAEHL
jgi:hypothetical protein